MTEIGLIRNNKKKTNKISQISYFFPTHFLVHRKVRCLYVFMNVCMYECISVWDYIDPNFINNNYNVYIHPIKKYYT